MMQPGLPDKWSIRDFPVLVATARVLEGGEMPATVGDIAGQLNPALEFEEIIAALKGLRHGYIIGKPMDTMGGTIDFFVTDMTERGRRAVGLWPSGESADVLVEVLRQAESLTDDPEEKTLIRRAAGAIGSISRDVMVDVLAAVISRQSGLG